METRQSKEKKQARYMKIGQLAEESGTNKSTIHHYLNLGLLPEPYRVGPKRHLYGDVHLAGLRAIHRLRVEKKLSLAKIKQILLDYDLDEESPSAVDTFQPEQEIEYFSEPLDESFRKKRDLLLDEAIELFAQNNVYDAVRISDIANAAQMGKATVYQYVTSKKDLFIQCIERLGKARVIPIQEQSDVKRETDFFKRIRKRLLFFLDEFSTFRGILNLARMVSGGKDPELAEKAYDAFRLVASAPKRDLEASQKSGGIREVDSELVAYILVGMAEILGQRLNMDSRYTPEEVAEVFIAFIKHGLAPKGESKDDSPRSAPLSGEIVGLTGEKIKVADISFEGQDKLEARFWDANVTIDLHKVATLSIQENGPSKCTVLVTTKDGEEMSLDVEGEHIITGQSPVGSFELRLEKASRIMFV